MKIVLMSFGSRGDIQPFIALGLALQKRGHSVNLAAPIDFEAQAKAYDIPFASIPLSMQEFVGKYFSNKELSPTTIFHLLRDAIPELRRRLYQTTKIVAELASDADLLLAHALLMPF